jgi:hypothetical protein
MKFLLTIDTAKTSNDVFKIHLLIDEKESSLLSIYKELNYNLIYHWKWQNVLGLRRRQVGNTVRVFVCQ